MHIKVSRRVFNRTVTKLLGLSAVASRLLPLRAWAKTAAREEIPLKLTAIAVTMQEVDLTWDAPTPARLMAQYVITRDGRSLITLAGTTLGYIDTSAQPGRAYTYTVTAIDSAGVTLARSLPVSAMTPATPDAPDIWPPSPPEGLSATPLPGHILLDWYGANDDTDITSYLIRRDGQRLALVNTGTLSYEDTSAQPGTRYTYSVEAIDTAGHHSEPEIVTDVQAMPSHSVFLPDVRSPQEATIQRTAQSIAAYNAKLRRYPYLTDLVGPYVTINWATDSSVATGSVKYGEVGVESPTAHTVTATKTSITVNSVTTYQWKAALTLSPDTQYAYRIYGGSTDLLGSDPAPAFWTQVPAGSGTPYSFVILGDWGDVDNAGSYQADLMQLIAQTGARFGLTTGDNAYPSGSQSNYGDLVQTGAGLSGIFGPQFWAVPGRSMALFPIMGNHGISNSDTNHPHLLNWPQQMAVQSSGGRYARETYSGLDGTTSASYPSIWFAFDAGPVRFYILHAAWADSNTGTASSPYEVDYDYHWAPSSDQYQWLANDLAAHPTAIKIAFFHYPLYSDNKTEKSDTFLQGTSSLEGLLTSNGVKLVFNGHSHLYQRSVVNDLTTYTLGATGTKLQPLDNGCSSVDAYALGWSNSKNKGYACGAAGPVTSKGQVYSFLHVSVNDNTVTVSPMNALGQTFDEQIYTFAGAGNLPTATVMPTVTTISLSPTPTKTPTKTPTTTPTSTPTSTSTSTPTPTDVPSATPTSTPTNTPTLTPTSTDVPPTATDAPLETPTATATDVSAATPTSTSTPTGVPPTPTRTPTPSPTGAPASTTPTPSTSIVFQDGFESGNLSAWTSDSGFTVQTTTVHNGGFAARANTTNGNTFAKKTLPSTYTNAYARIYFNLISYSSQVNLLRVRTAGDLSIVYLFISTAGKLGLRNDIAGTTFTSTTSVGSGWHSLELHTVINGASGITEVWLDGIRINDLSITTNMGSTAIGRLQIGEVNTGRTYHVVIDDVAFDTQQLGL